LEFNKDKELNYLT